MGYSEGKQVLYAGLDGNMPMKRRIEEEIINVILPYIDYDGAEDVKMKITMLLSGYDVIKRETAVTVYEGDINEQMLKRFLIAKAARGCSPRTVNYYRNSIRAALQMIGKAYTDVTADDIRIYLAVRVQRDHVSKTTANNERRNLSAFYTWLQKEEILIRNPMNKVEAIKETKKKKKAYTQMEIEKIRAACQTNRERALIEVLISTWCRVSEVAQIKLQDIDGNKIMVVGKGDKEREVYLTPKAQLMVETYLQERHDNNPYLFARARYTGRVGEMERLGVSRNKLNEWYMYAELVGSGHTDAGTIESIVRRLGKRAGVEKTHPHRFRRTSATMALRAGMPILTVSKMLGHESIATTQIYLDITDDELEQYHSRYS